MMLAVGDGLSGNEYFVFALLPIRLSPHCGPALRQSMGLLLRCAISRADGLQSGCRMTRGRHPAGNCEDRVRAFLPSLETADPVRLVPEQADCIIPSRRLPA